MDDHGARGSALPLQGLEHRDEGRQARPGRDEQVRHARPPDRRDGHGALWV